MSDVIRVEELFKTYRMGDVEVPALRGVSLAIRKGELSRLWAPRDPVNPPS